MITSEKYIDITKEWLENATPNSHKIKDCLIYEDNGVIYNVDGKNVILDYSEKELEIAKFLKETFGGEIYMVPRICYPYYLKTPDYLFNSKKFDLKEINGNSPYVIDNASKNKKLQACNFILDINETKLSINEILSQIISLYNNPKRKCINTIILIKNNKLISVFTRI